MPGKPDAKREENFLKENAPVSPGHEEIKIAQAKLPAGRHAA
jgi:hypothetical protein